MAGNEKTVIRPATLGEVRQLLQLAEGDDVQQVGLDKILSGCCFFVLEGTPDKLAFAMIQQGRELWIQAAGGRGERDLTRLILQSADAIAEGEEFNSIGFQTRRPGLVRKAEAMGYKVDGYIMRKKL